MRFTAVLALLGVSATLACGDDDTTDPGTDGGDFTVNLGSTTFTPSSLSVPVGSTVTWQWTSTGIVHDVTFEDGQESPDQSTGTYARTFTATGDYAYICTFHVGQGMVGTVSVTASPTGGTGNGGTGGGGGGSYP
jgi:plastocyanin